MKFVLLQTHTKNKHFKNIIYTRHENPLEKFLMKYIHTTRASSYNNNNNQDVGLPHTKIQLILCYDECITHIIPIDWTWLWFRFSFFRIRETNSFVFRCDALCKKASNIHVLFWFFYCKCLRTNMFNLHLKQK